MPRSRSQLRIFGQALWLGLRSFGGPVRHLRIFDKKFVQESSQISESEFSALVSLASLLPGPTSSQVGVAIGSELGGLLGACAFWLGFTLPSFLIMYALSLAPVTRITSLPWLLWVIKVGILLIVLKALGGLTKRFARQRPQQVISVVAFIYFHFISNSYLQLAGLVVAAFVGSLFIKSEVQSFIGAKSGQAPHGFLGALEATFGIFLPGGLLMLSGTYFWKKWSRNARFLSAVSGVNAAVLGLLAVACIDIIRLH